MTNRASSTFSSIFSMPRVISFLFVLPDYAKIGVGNHPFIVENSIFLRVFFGVEICGFSFGVKFGVLDLPTATLITKHGVEMF